MPPVAKIVGLILVLANPVCLAAQDYSSHSNTPFAPRAPGGPRGQEWVDPSGRSGAGTSRFPIFPVRQAEFQSPLPAGEVWSDSGSRDPVHPPPPAGLEGERAGATGLTSSQPAGPLPPLPPPNSSGRGESGNRSSVSGKLAPLLTVGSSLAVVLGLFFVLAWALRRASPNRLLQLPSEVVEVLGRAPLAGRQQVHLLRCGNKLLLVSVTPEGVETLTEITDTDEVNRLAGLCRRAQPDSATAAFRQVFQHFAGQHTKPGFVDEGNRDKLALANAGIPATRDGRAEDA